MRRRRIASLALVAAAAIAGGAPSAMAAHSASSSSRSPSKKAFWAPVTDFPILHNLGVGIYEDVLSWAAAAPTRPSDPSNPNDPAYQWNSEISYAIQQAAHYHMRVLLQISQTPAWENGGHAANYPPRNVADLAAFVMAAARRYPSVHLWMIWGEPDRKPNWATLVPASPTATSLKPAQAAAPRLYAQMLDASYGALKQVSPRNLVIGGNTYTTGDIPVRMWIKYMRLPDGKPPRMDLYGHNPFCFRAPNLSNPPSRDGEMDFSDLGRLERLVNRELARPHHTIKLFLSEWEIPTARDNELNIYVTPAIQAQWITDAWRIVRHSSWIYALGWIHLYDDLPGGSMSGLFYHDGQPKPGYYAFKNG
jgi:hypothetical protein